MLTGKKQSTLGVRIVFQTLGCKMQLSHKFGNKLVSLLQPNIYEKKVTWKTGVMMQQTNFLAKY